MISWFLTFLNYALFSDEGWAALASRRRRDRDGSLPRRRGEGSRRWDDDNNIFGYRHRSWEWNTFLGECCWLWYVEDFWFGRSWLAALYWQVNLKARNCLILLWPWSHLKTNCRLSVGDEVIPSVGEVVVGFRVCSAAALVLNRVVFLQVDIYTYMYITLGTVSFETNQFLPTKKTPSRHFHGFDVSILTICVCCLKIQPRTLTWSELQHFQGVRGLHLAWFTARELGLG